MPDNQHQEAIEILSRQIITLYKQAEEFDHSNFPDRAARGALCRAKARAVKSSMQVLENDKPKGVQL